MKTLTAYIAFALSAALSTALPQQHQNHQPDIPSSIPLNLTKGDIAKLAITGGIIEGSPDGSNMLVAPGRAIVNNKCPFDLYMQSVNPTSDEPGKQHPSQRKSPLSALQHNLTAAYLTCTSRLHPPSRLDLQRAHALLRARLRRRQHQSVVLDR
jgi:hypothetical protein